MKTTESTTTNTNHFTTIHLSALNVPVPANIEFPSNVNIQAALEHYLRQHTEVMAQILREQMSKPQPKGKWAEAAKRLSTQHTLSPEAGKALKKGIAEFRETFAIGDNFD
jgi:hypothetical protein